MRLRPQLLTTLCCSITLLLHACVEGTLVELKDSGTNGQGSGGAGGTSGNGSGGKGGGGGINGTGGKGGNGSGGKGGSGGASGSGGISGTGGNAPRDAATDAAGDPDGGAPGERTFSTDRADFFGDSRCAASGTLLCEDFESGAIDNGRWSTMLAPATVDGMQHARGTKALHVSTSGIQGSGIETDEIFPVAGDVYYGRMFVYFSALPEQPDGAHWTIAGANPADDDQDESEIRVGGQYQGDMNLCGIGTDRGPTGDWTNHDDDPNGSPVEPPTGEWICIEWMHDAGDDETRFWWDGVEHESLATTRDTPHQGNADVDYNIPRTAKVWVGFWNYFGTPETDEFDTWIDEVALDDERIGCDI